MIACFLRRKWLCCRRGQKRSRKIARNPADFRAFAVSRLDFIRMTPPTISATPTHFSHENGIFSAPSQPNTSISAATVNCESKIAEIATVGVRLPIAHITVSVITGASTPPSHAYHGACGNSRMLPLPKKTAMSSASKNRPAARMRSSPASPPFRQAACSLRPARSSPRLPELQKESPASNDTSC